MNEKSFSDLLKEHRIKKGMTKKDAAEIIGIPYTTYSNYENGREPKQSMKNTIANKLEIPFSELLDSETILGVVNEITDEAVKDFSVLFNSGDTIDLNATKEFDDTIFFSLRLSTIVDLLKKAGITVHNPLTIDNSKIIEENWRHEIQKFPISFDNQNELVYYLSLDQLKKLQKDIISFIQFSTQKEISENEDKM